MDFDVLKKELAEHKVYTAWQFIENTNANIRVAQYCLDTITAISAKMTEDAHKNNEEIYAVVSGRGKAVIDGETVELSAGDWLRISPAAKRQFSAAEDSPITFFCIQVKENSLGGYTQNDAVVE